MTKTQVWDAKNMDKKRSAKGGRYIALNLCLNRRREDIATRKKRKNLFYKADTISSKAYAVRTIVHKTEDNWVDE